MSSPTSGNLCPIKQEVSSLQLWSQVWLFQKYLLIVLLFVCCLAYWLFWFCSSGGSGESLVGMGNNTFKSQTNSCVTTWNCTYQEPHLSHFLDMFYDNLLYPPHPRPKRSSADA